MCLPILMSNNKGVAAWHALQPDADWLMNDEALKPAGSIHCISHLPMPHTSPISSNFINGPFHASFALSFPVAKLFFKLNFLPFFIWLRNWRFWCSLKSVEECSLGWADDRLLQLERKIAVILLHNLNIYVYSDLMRGWDKRGQEFFMNSPLLPRFWILQPTTCCCLLLCYLFAFSFV